MKCIYCQKDSKLSERSGGRCPGCNKAFAFEPTAGSKHTDMAFKNAIDAVSSRGAVRFLPEHVRYELARRSRRKTLASVTLFAIAGLTLLLAVWIHPAIGILTLIFGGIGAMAWPSSQLPNEEGTFRAEWSKWCATHGNPPGLIVRKTEQKAPVKATRPADIQHYSFDRAVICDREETVDMLLANNFHFENNCAILAWKGYPPRAFETVKAMLQSNPRLTVYVLHDATQEGCLLAIELASSPAWFRGRARVVEVGIRPAHARSLKGLWIPGGPPIAVGAGLTKAEAAWLSVHALELFAVRPEQVIKRLYRAICTDVDKLSQASDFVVVDQQANFWVDGASFSTDATSSDGGDDSFG